MGRTLWLVAWGVDLRAGTRVLVADGGEAGTQRELAPATQPLAFLPVCTLLGFVS